MSKPTFYMTTPIYYPSDSLHIGHAYCSTAADTMCRFKKQTGYDVYFLTGTDEHGQKIERKAQAKGTTPQAYVDAIVAGIKDLWTRMDIEYDQFIRTTDPRHEVVVQRIFQQLYEQGDIYKGTYEGWYCAPCEAFWTERQLKDHKCPDCERDVELVQEEAYFFRLSKYADWLIEYIESHPDFIQPPVRAKEMLNNFLRPGLEDLCVSRTSFTWGIPVTFDPGHVVYVWIDALSNYITALGYGSDDDSLYQKYWPADIHLVGKEIVRFHTIIWPIMLRALGLPQPKQIFGHGWLVLQGKKMSKSVGNVVDPVVLCERYTSDAIRYFLMREIPFGADGQFSNEALLTRMNADLSNDLGNLVSRTVAMIEKYFGGDLPALGDRQPCDDALIDMAEALPAKVEDAMNRLQFAQALQEIWAFIGESNRYIDITMPWVLGKNEADKPRLGTVLYVLAECVRWAAVLIAPFMPRTPARIYAQIGVTDDALTTWESLQGFGKLKAGTRVKKGEALFPRIDIAKEMAALAGNGAEDGAGEGAGRANVAMAGKDGAKAKDAKNANGGARAGDADATDASAQAGDAGTGAKSQAAAHDDPEPPAEIAIDDFAKVSLRIARVTACEKVPKSDKLLKLTLDVGGEERTVVSGIALHYAPEAMVGKQVVLLANLKPAKLRGVMSQGMILAASDDEGRLSLLTVDGEVADGGRVS